MMLLLVHGCRRMFEVFDNFLDLEDFKNLRYTITNDEFPWYYMPGVCFPDDEFFHFSNIVDKDNPPMDIVKVLDKLNAKKLIRCKINLSTRTVFNRFTGWHNDFENITTAILYLNTCNGYTRFKKGGKVNSVANRVVVFDSNLKHAAVTQTDEKRRMVINLNYV